MPEQLKPWHYAESHPVGDDALIINESTVRALEYHLSHLIWRAVYYQEFPRTSDEFKGMIREITLLLSDLRRSNNG